MRGRKPTPTALRTLRGNPGRRPMPADEPRPAAAVPERPDCLDDEAAREWDRVVPTLSALGILTDLDRAMLVAYCTAWSDFLRLKEEIAAEGWWIPTGDGTSKKKHPAAASIRETYERMRSAASELGMTPSARVRLATPGKKAEDDPLDELARRRRKRR